MSTLQFGTLKFFVNHAVTVEDIQAFNLTTLGSLIRRGWVGRKGNQIVATTKGVEAYERYHKADANYRMHDGAPISDRVRTMLHLSQLHAVKAIA